VKKKWVITFFFFWKSRFCWILVALFKWEWKQISSEWLNSWISHVWYIFNHKKNVRQNYATWSIHSIIHDFCSSVHKALQFFVRISSTMQRKKNENCLLYIFLHTFWFMRVFFSLFTLPTYLYSKPKIADEYCMDKCTFTLPVKNRKKFCCFCLRFF
jgi:hypothetical protein